MDEKFEYHVVRVSEDKDGDQEALLTNFGREGWRLVSVIKEEEEVKFYLMRKCEEC